MKTGDMIQSIKDNLGNRNSGKIGGRDVDTVVLEALNLAVPHCVLEAQPDYYNRTAEIAMVVGQREYPLPTKDTDGADIRMKNLYGYRCYRAGGTAIDLVQVNYHEFIKLTANYDLNYTGTPRYFAFWGKENTIHFDYLPSEDYTFTMYLETYPNQITSNQYEIPLPLDDQWNIVVEAFATKHCFLKLQQREMYLIWEKLYLEQKASISRDESVKQGENISASTRAPLLTDPALNPMVNNWNN